MDYSFEAEKEEEHLRRMDAWQLLVEGDKEWQILTEQQNTNIRNHAGATRSLKRAECKITKGHPFYIKTNVDTIQVVLHNKESLIILPDKVLFVRKRKVGAIDYTDFIINVSSTRFVESDPVPKDAQIVGQTWQYVNKNCVCKGFAYYHAKAQERINAMKKHTVHNKLVRDRIPEIIASSGKTCVTEVLPNDAYIQALDAKLNEELAEYQQSKSLEELADLLEVMGAVVKARGYTWDDLTRVRKEKRAQRGAFEQRIFLKEVIE